MSQYIENVFQIICSNPVRYPIYNTIVTAATNLTDCINLYTNVIRLEIDSIIDLSSIKINCNHTNLKTLVLYQCDVSNFHQIEHWNIPNLQTLDINNKYKSQQLTTLDGIEKFSNLINLSLHRINITTLNPLKTLTRLRSLDFKNYPKWKTTQKSPSDPITSLDYTPLKQLPNLNSLDCDLDYSGNLWELHELPELSLTEDKNEYLIEESPYLQLEVFEKFITLLTAYTKLMHYSTEKDFVTHIVSIDDLPNNQYTIFHRLKTLQSVYDKLEHAPYGPVFNKGLKLCKG